MLNKNSYDAQKYLFTKHLSKSFARFCFAFKVHDLSCVRQRSAAGRQTKVWTLNFSKYLNTSADLLILVFGLMILALLSAACESPSLKKTNRVVSTPENKQPVFESDLQTMKTANFEYIFVFRRKDGGAFEGEDRKYLRANSPPEINRFISTDDGKAFIAGSKYKFPPENLETLRLRFNIEDYSTPPTEAK